MIGPADLLPWLEYAGVAVLAASGALAAARLRHDIGVFCLLAALAGLGGGMVRDLLIGAPVFWVQQPAFLAVCLVAAAVIWIVGGELKQLRLLLWLDAVGLSALAVLGAAKAADANVPPLAAAFVGLLSASVGGLLRDLLTGQPLVLLRREIYVIAAAAGAGLYVALRLAEVETALSAALGFGAAFGLRGGALRYGWTLPGFPGQGERPAPPEREKEPPKPAASPWTGVPPTGE